MLDYEYDEYADDDPRLDVVEPMKPIRLPYETGSLRQIQRDVLASLGLISVEVRGNLFALNEVDTNMARLTATEELMSSGLDEALVTDEAVLRRAEAIVRRTVIEHASSFVLSALHTVPTSVAVQKHAQEQHAIADAELMRNGVDMKAKRDHARAEWEAA